MKNLIILKYVFFCLILCACEKDKDIENSPFVIEDISFENYPKVDASTSTTPLQKIIACKLLGVDYRWQKDMAYSFTYDVFPDYEKMPSGFLYDHIKSSGTHGAFMNLIDKEVDFILTARTASTDELAYAFEQGVSLLETPVALDAFIFITHPDNPVESLTTKQIQDVYQAKITQWSEVGGTDRNINPYIRNANSGSQELMESLIMKGLDMIDWPEAILTGMMGPFNTLRNDIDGLCYTVYYFREQMVRDDIVKQLSVDGIYPDGKSIKDQSYPYTTEVYAVIRTDQDKNSPAYKIYEELLSEAGQALIKESGYIEIK